jgi:hypothetical protein
MYFLKNVSCLVHLETLGSCAKQNYALALLLLVDFWWEKCIELWWEMQAMSFFSFCAHNVQS